MAQFDVYKNPRGGTYPLVVDVQSEALGRTDHRVVVPMVARKKYGAKPIARLNPVMQVAGVEYVLLFHYLAAMPVDELGARVSSLAARRAELIAAIDFLFTSV